jgi:NAD(P)-dependent dehydrogenase (short-subunit alcohol dehydrogenase family)
MTILNMFELTGRVALLTGGAGLLGRAFAQTLAEAGAAIAIADIDGAATHVAAEALAREGGQALGLESDVTQPESVRAMVNSTLEAFGRLDILVNSAALDPKFDPGEAEIHTAAFENFPLEAWNRSLAVDLTGMFLSSQAATRPMLEQGQGVIINLCSIYGLVGPDQRIYQRPGEPPAFKPITYSVTKAGVLGMTHYLAAYFGSQNIRVNALTPGGVFNDHDETFVKEYSARVILRRMGRVDELQGALLFLASDASSYMTGANLVVDGGWTAW